MSVTVEFKVADITERTGNNKSNHLVLETEINGVKSGGIVINTEGLTGAGDFFAVDDVFDVTFTKKIT